MRKPTLIICRRTFQITVAIAFIIIPWLNHLHISLVYGNFLSFRFLKLPLADPLAVLQIMLKNNYFCAELMIGAAIALVTAALLGTVFCSWVCPFGLLSEWGQKLSRWMRRRKRSSSEEGRLNGFHTKFLIFALGLAGFLLFSTTPVLNQLSLPAWYSRIFQFWFEQGHISLAIIALLGLIALEMVFDRRIWCRYICPQSVLIALAKQLNHRRLRVHFQSDACICRGKSDPCSGSCTLGLEPKTFSMWPELECSNCGDCISACKKRGRALTFRIKPIKNDSYCKRQR